MVLAGNQVMVGVEGAARLLGTVLVIGVGTTVQAAAHSCTSLLTPCTPAVIIVHSTCSSAHWQHYQQ